MKYFFTFILSAFCCTFASAQINIGINTSLGFQLAHDETAFSGDPFEYINHEMTYQGANLVKSYGIFAQQKFGYLFGRSELAFTHFKQEYLVRSFVQFGQGNQTVFEKFQFIDFRLMAGVTHNNARIGVGPVAHILIGNDDEIDIISGYNERHRGLTYGFLFTVGFDAGRLHVDLRYENTFRSVGDHIFFGTRSAQFKNKPNTISLVIGVSI